MDRELRRKLDKWVSERYEWVRNEITTNICKGQMREYADDLTIHMIESLYNLPEPKLNQLLDDNKLRWYVLTGAGRELRSSSSPFYRTYRKEKSWSREEGHEGTSYNIFDIVYEEYDESLYQCFQEEFNNLHFYQQALMTKYFYEGWSLTKMYEYYNISKTHLTRDLNETIEQIRNKCNEC